MRKQKKNSGRDATGDDGATGSERLRSSKDAPIDRTASAFAVFGDEWLAAKPLVCPNLTLPEQFRSGSRLGRFAAEMSAEPAGQNRRNLVRTTLATIGFDWVCYMRFFRIGERITRADYFSSYSPPGWPLRYISKRHFEIDPRVGFGCRYDWPLVWDLDSLTDRVEGAHAPGRMGQFRSDARSAGLSSGVTFDLTSTTYGFDHRVVSFGSSERNRAWIADHVVGQAYAIAVGLHEFLVSHAKTLGPESDVKPVTGVQQHILRLLTDGHSDNEIAQELDMSVHNVGYHLRQLREKFGALNRVQLAYIAGRLANR